MVHGSIVRPLSQVPRRSAAKTEEFTSHSLDFHGTALRSNSQKNGLDFTPGSLTGFGRKPTSDSLTGICRKPTSDSLTVFREKSTSDSLTSFGRKSTSDSLTGFGRVSTSDSLKCFHQKFRGWPKIVVMRAVQQGSVGGSDLGAGGRKATTAAVWASKMVPSINNDRLKSPILPMAGESSRIGAQR